LFKYLDWLFLTKDQLRMVAGPVSMPFMGCFVIVCAYCDQKTNHGLRAAHVTKYDWKLHTAGPIRFHPPISREAETLKLLTKVLHHVISLHRQRT